jgi:tetratricopeptide (TPR) repeat protein
MDRWALTLTLGATNELQKARILFDTLTRHINQGPSTGSKTAREVFEAWDKSGQSFNCQEYANIYVALARAVRLKAFLVFVSEGFDGGREAHACAGVYAGGKLLLVDPSLCWFGVPHKQFMVLDDLQAVGHHLSQQSGLAFSRTACKLAPDLSIAQANLFYWLARTDQWQEASEVLTNVLRLDPSGPLADSICGLWALHNGKQEEAANFFRRSVELDPNQGAVYSALANVLLAQGKFREARDIMRKALHCGLSDVSAEQTRQMIARINEQIGSD